MSGQERDEARYPPNGAPPDIDASEIAERVNEALEPAMSEAGDRLAEAVAQRLASLDLAVAEQPKRAEQESEAPSQTDTAEEQDETSDVEIGGESDPAETEDRHQPESRNSGDKRSDPRASSDGSFIGTISKAFTSSFVESIRHEGNEQLESIIDVSLEKLFSSRGRGVIRHLADHTLQAALYDIVDSIDDHNERYQLYRDSLGKLRPIVRDAVDAMFTDQSKNTLERKLHHAIPSLLDGDFDTAFAMIVAALSEVTDHAEEVIWRNSGDVLIVVQQISTKLLTETIQDAAEDKFDPEEIQGRVQEKVENARSKLEETVGSLQERVREAQERLGGSAGGRDGSNRRGAPAGMPPSGHPPVGFPPSGRHPSGTPPTGKPPHGSPPSGLPPAVERQRNAAGRSSSRSNQA